MIKIKTLFLALVYLTSTTSWGERGMIIGVLSDVHDGWSLSVDNDLKLSIIEIDTDQARDKVWEDVVEKYPFEVSFNSKRKSIWIKKSLSGVGRVVNLSGQKSILAKPLDVKTKEVPKPIDVKTKEIVRFVEVPVPGAPVKQDNRMDEDELESILGSISSVKQETIRVKKLLDGFHSDSLNNLTSKDIAAIVTKAISDLQKKHYKEIDIIINKTEELVQNTILALNRIKKAESANSGDGLDFQKTISSINYLLAGMADGIEINQLRLENNGINMGILKGKHDISSSNINSKLVAILQSVKKQMDIYNKDINNNIKSMSGLYKSINNNAILIKEIGAANLEKFQKIDISNRENQKKISNDFKTLNKKIKKEFNGTQGIIINIAKSLKKDIKKQFDYLEKLTSSVGKNSVIIENSAKNTIASNNRVITTITDVKQLTVNNHADSILKINEIAAALKLQNETIDKINKENELIKKTRGESDVVVRLLINSLFDVSEAKGMIVTDVFSRKTELRHINIHIGAMKIRYGSGGERFIRNKDINLTLNNAGLVQIEGLRGGEEVYFLINKWYHEKYKKLSSVGGKNRFYTVERKLSVKFDINGENPKNIEDMRNTGQEIYNSSCYNCHESGFGGAIEVGDHKSWKQYRNENTIKSTLDNILSGIGKMPRKGSCYDCSNEELIEAIKYLTGLDI